MVKPIKVYAVRKGREVGLFNTWEECEKQVKGYPGAEHKSFLNRSEARQYLRQEELAVQTTQIPKDEMVAFVDGSYNSDTGKYGAGVVTLYQSKKHSFSRKGTDPIQAKMRNVAGEIMAAMQAMKQAIQQKVPNLTIHHDYYGIEKWCTGEWKTNKEGTIKYKKFYDAVSGSLNVSFVKVKGHSGNKYHDEADELARRAVGK